MASGVASWALSARVQNLEWQLTNNRSPLSSFLSITAVEMAGLFCQGLILILAVGLSLVFSLPVDRRVFNAGPDNAVMIQDAQHYWFVSPLDDNGS